MNKKHQTLVLLDYISYPNYMSLHLDTLDKHCDELFHKYDILMKENKVLMKYGWNFKCVITDPLQSQVLHWKES